MKRMFSALVSAALGAALAGCAFAQGNPRGTAELDLNGTHISINYGRPSLRGRTVQSMLEKLPANGFWRLGADQSTTFSTSGDLQFGDVTVPKGEYSLWAQKQADGSWKLVFNKQHGQWGTEHDPLKDFAFVPLKEEKEPQSAEMLTIELENENGGELSIHWGDMELSTHFKTKS